MSLLLNSSTAETIWNFDPRSVPDCALWFDAADTNTISLSGTTVLSWNSKGYISVAAVRRTGTCTYSSSNTVNGINAIHCPSGADLGITFALLGTGGKSFFGVGKTDSLSAFSGSAMTFISSGLLNVTRGASAENHSIVFGNSGISVGNILYPLRYANVYTGISGSTQALNYGGINGQSIGFLTNSLRAGAIGSAIRTISSSANAIPATICEIIAYDRNVTPSERMAIEGYLMWKWGAASYQRPDFTPLNIPGCQLWLDSDVDTGSSSTNFTFSSGVNISTWNDLSGNGNHASLLGGTTAPTLVQDATLALGLTKYVVSFAGNGSLLSPLNVPSTQPVTVFLVGRPNSLGVLYGFIGLNSYGGTRGSQLIIYQNTTSTWVFSGGTAGTIGNTATTATSTSRFDIVTCYWSPTLRTQVNAAGSYSLPSSLAPTSLVGGTTTIGSVTNSGANTSAAEFLNGRIAEIIVYYGTLTESQQFQVERYLSNKWNRPLQHTVGLVHPARFIQPFGRQFNPVDTDNLVAWYDMADRTTVSGSGTITVVDKSPTTRGDTIPLTGSSINETGGLGNALSTVTVTTDQSVNSSTVNLGFGGNTASTVVFVGNTAAQTMSTLRSTTSGSIRVQITATNVSALNNQVGNQINSTVLANRTKLAIASHPGGTLAGALTLHECGTSYGNTGTYILNQGDSRVRMGIATSANGEFGEVMYFSKQLTSEERQRIEGYLAEKWNLRANLAITHPYYYGSAITNITQFNPTSISGCRVWLDATDISTVNSGSIASGGTVTSWADKSGLGTSFTITGSPTWALSINGRGAINTTSGRMLASFGTPLTTFRSTTFIVSSLISTPTAGWPCVTYTDGGAVGTGTRFNALDFSAGFRGAMTIGGSTWVATMTASSNNVPFIWVSTFNGTNSIAINRNAGATTGSGTTSVAATTNASLYYIGQTPAIANTNTWPGHISEIITYDSVLTAANIIAVSQYLAQKYGMVPELLAANQFRIPLSLPNTAIFIPTYVSTCTLWLDGRDPRTVLIADGAVRMWMDKSGTGRHALQITPSLRPSYSNDAIVFPDLKYLNLVVANGMLATTTQLYSIFIVERRTSNKSGNLILGFSGAANNGIAMGYNSNTEFRLTSAQTVDTNYAVAGYQDTDPIRIWAGVYNGSTRILYLNGVAVTTTAYTTAVGTWLTPTIGWFSGFGNNFFYVGNIYEIIVYNTAISALDRQRTEGYLAWKWGLQTSLPTYHPFRKFIP